jgi:galactokinase/mevalonate kinase-like predicted kinase
MALPEYENLKRMVTEVEEDLNKAVGGNKAAGTRVRKKMQEIKAEAQKIRQRILENREGESSGAASEDSAPAEQQQ